mmetsp:Transcript_82122/g.249069  ORF Transcript_82122/g.249069 Transcript_82122/m.249069 type:complete len:497 (+) Transcript_82122:58-1548(+)
MARVPMPKPALEELAFVDQQDTWPWQEGEQSTASSVDTPGISAISSPAGTSSSVMLPAQQASAWSQEADHQGPAGVARTELMRKAAMAEAKAAAQQHEEWVEQQRAYEEQLATWQMLPVALAPVHMLVCEAPLPQQACAGQVPAATAPADPSQAAQAEEPCAEYEAEQQEEAAKSQSARRRLRRQRAARRRPAVVPLTSGAEALQAEASEAGSGAASEGELEAKSCEELAKGLEAGGAARLAAVEALRGSVLRCALAATGCRVVQLALEVAERRAAEELVAELHGHVQEAIESPHANYVIQKVIEVMPVTVSSFVAEELRGVGAVVARHRYGCRILCRLLEHTSSSASLAEVINELLAETADLCRHSFGHHVMESLLEHGHLVQQQQVVAVLREDLLSHAQHRCASHVVEAALAHCSAADQAAVAGDLLHEDKMVSLAQNQFGSFVAKALLMLPGGTRAAAWGHLQQGAARLKETKPGQRLLRDLGLGSVAAAAAP